jgi:DnaJ-class molecular chaperone
MADEDPYVVLGLSRDATEQQIRAAYRKLAKSFHPDLNPGDKAAEERFKKIASANDILSDTDKRARYDRGEIDASGQKRPERPFYRSQAESPAGAKYHRAGASDPLDEEELGDLFSELFRAQGAGPAGPGRARTSRNRPIRGHDQNYLLSISFLEAVNGTTSRLIIPGGGTLDVKVPPGIVDGQMLRLRGRGEPGLNGGPAGDALIELVVAPHHLFRRDGDDILLDVPVLFREAVLGARITVPTPGGKVALTVPPHSDSGTRLRLRGRGVPAHGDRAAGDFLVTLKLVAGPPDAELEQFLASQPPSSFDPRAELEAEQ